MQKIRGRFLALETDVLTAWIVAHAVVGFIVIMINTLALYVFVKNKLLRTRKHYMIINLTVSDFLFGLTGIPPAVFFFNPSDIAFDAFYILNRFTKMASLLTLCVIAVERMHAIVWPLHHRVLGNGVFKTALVFCWVLSAVITALVSLRVYNPMFGATMPFTVIGMTIVIVASYITIWVFAKCRKGHIHNASTNHRDKALAVTLLLISGAFLITWVLPILYMSISYLCKTCHRLPGSVILWLHLVFAFQSVINPVIYCFRIPGFQDTLRKVKLKKMWRFQKNKVGQGAIESQMRSL